MAKSRLDVCGAVAVALLASSLPASALTFDFSFTNAAANGGGTVMGSIVLNAADTAALSVTVTSNTSSFGSFGIGEYVGNPFANSFTVSGGLITHADFLSLGVDNTSPDVTCCTLGFAVSAGLSDHNASLPINNSPNLTFTPTPLPATLPLFATGLGALGLLGWRRKRRAAVKG
jgi:hypothetical protein